MFNDAINTTQSEVNWAKINISKPRNISSAGLGASSGASSGASLGASSGAGSSTGSDAVATIKIEYNGWTIAVMPDADAQNLEKALKAVKSCC